MRFVLPLFLAALLAPSPSFCADENLPSYTLQIACYADSMAGKRKYVFLIGQTAYRSVDDLKKGLTHYPKGSTLRWAPSCRRFGDEPILSSEKDMTDFRNYCIAIGLNFVLVPSG